MSGDRHDGAELGAHLLGLLDDDAARAVEEHLSGCPACRREWEELREMTDLLGDMPPEAFLEGPPDGDLVLQRTLRQVRAETGARRRRRRWGAAVAAAAVVAAVLGGGVVLGRATAPGPAAPGPTAVAQAPGVVTLAGAGTGGVTMTTTVTPAAGWVRLVATVSGIPAGENCRLLVIGRDGSRAIAGTWIVPPTGEEAGVTLHGSAAIAPAAVAAVVVENSAGREFVQLRV